MINRINLILRAKNITAKQFAEEIGIQPSGMSHIMSGRNNPSLEFVNKVIRRYPEIDANWLLLGKGEMYESAVGTPASAAEPTLFTSTESIEEPQPEAPLPLLEQEPQREPAVESAKKEAPRPTVTEVPVSEPVEGRRLVKILFFYDDRTFEEYRPE